MQQQCEEIGQFNCLPKQMKNLLTTSIACSLLLSAGEVFASTELETLNKICAVAGQDAAFAIVIFDKWKGEQPTKTKQGLRERSREVHAFLMNMERKRVEDIVAETKRETGRDYSSLAMEAINWTDMNYKYALCQREKRLTAASETIQNEAIQRCVSVHQRRITETHQLCF
jgi:hypothetical protein